MYAYSRILGAGEKTLSEKYAGGKACGDRVAAGHARLGGRGRSETPIRKMLSQVRLSRSLLRIFYSFDAALQAS